MYVLMSVCVGISMCTHYMLVCGGLCVLGKGGKGG